MTTTTTKSSSNRRNWKAEDAIQKALDHMKEHPEASGSDIARLLGISETQGKTYRRLALQKLQSGRSDLSLNT